MSAGAEVICFVLRWFASCYWVVLRFFQDKNASTIKGPLDFLVRLAALVGLILAAHLISRPASLSIKNADPFACLDLQQLAEADTRGGLEYPEALKSRLVTLLKATHRRWGQVRIKVAHQSQRAFPPVEEVEHQLLCWFQPPRTAAEELRIKNLRDGCYQFEDEKQPSSAYEWSRFNLGAVAMPSRCFGPPYSHAAAALGELSLLGTADSPVTVWGALRPHARESRYFKEDAWEADLVAIPTTLNDVLGAVEGEGMSQDDQGMAFGLIQQSRWIVNILEVRNNSGHAAATGVVVRLSRAGKGLTEYVGGSIRFSQTGDGLQAEIGRLLPGDTRWAVIRTALGVMVPSEVTVLSDPADFFDRRLLVWLSPFLMIPVMLYVLANYVHRGGAQDR